MQSRSRNITRAQRSIAAPEMNLNKAKSGVTHYRWEAMPKEQVNDLLERRLITGDSMMLAHVYLKKG